jgi:monovalent cation:H+ antiporter, CPA1 family
LNRLEYIALLLAITAGFAYANHYLLGLPRSSGLLILALTAALVIRLIEREIPQIGPAAALRHDLANTDFGALLLKGFLGFLLFASALDLDLRLLFARKWTILALATVGVVISTFAMAVGIYIISRLVDIDLPFAYCLVFGALISPTDPVTVADVLRRLGVPDALQGIIAGESRFNDGIGIVLFTMFLEQATSGGNGDVSVGHAALEFAREAGGGALLGTVTGGLAFAAMRGIDEYTIELMISLALASGTYGIAESLGVSGPVAVVAAGLIMGSVGVQYAVSRTHEYLQKFWSMTEELLNGLLFLLIGLEFTVIELRWAFVTAAGLTIPLSLVVRGCSIVVASLPLNLRGPNKLRAIALLTWSGLRGGISVALVLSLPPSRYREALLTACYGVVIFTMVVQGLSLDPIASRLFPQKADRHEPAPG